MSPESELEPGDLYVRKEAYSVPGELRRVAHRERVAELLEKLTRLGQQTEWDQDWFRQVWQTTSSLNTYLAASASAIGECRRQVPYAALKPVIDAQGNFKWCCDHNPEHCV